MADLFGKSHNYWLDRLGVSEDEIQSMIAYNKLVEKYDQKFWQELLHQFY